LQKATWHEVVNPLIEKHKVTLVVGTTPDYIEWIRKIAPDKSIFLTDPVIRQRAKEPSPEAKEEILCDPANYQLASACIREHLEYWGLELDGITCFDCESMELTAVLAEQYSLPYPSCESIGLCRNKYLSKLKWQENGLNCPKTKNIHSSSEAERFLAELDGHLVLKPVTGSGSEYVCLCRSSKECHTNYELILSALKNKRSNRLYRSSALTNELVVAEEFIDGEEYSCDFMIDNNQIQLVRLTKKIRAKNRPFGTIHGYVLCNTLPEKLSKEVFFETLKKSTDSLQIYRGICMLDFIVRNNEMVLLEIAPRPGGDCLPYLLHKARGLDILKLSLDFARQEHADLSVNLHDFAPGFMGIRIIGKKDGILREININALKKDQRVLEIGLSKEPGHIIVMPPDDYDSWILGYIIAMVEPDKDPLAQLIDIDKKINIVMDIN
jgi:biotin carboxylase